MEEGPFIPKSRHGVDSKLMQADETDIPLFNESETWCAFVSKHYEDHFVNRHYDQSAVLHSVCLHFHTSHV